MTLILSMMALILLTGIFILLIYIDELLAAILRKLNSGGGGAPSAITISQLQGGHTMPITGITLGATGVFQESPTPAGTTFPPNTKFTWSADDALVTLTPSADTTQVAAATVSTDTAPSFNLTCSGGGLTATVNVPLLNPAPTGIAINQLS